MPEVDNNGVHLYYEDSGSGLPLLLSHSWFCNGQQWPQVPDLLAAGYRVLNLDNRGHGRSGPCAERYSLWEMSEDLIAVLDHAEVDSAVLVGLSVGGFCSIRAALGHPDRVRGLVLADADAGPAALSGKVKATLLTPVARTRWGKPIAISAVVDVLFGETTRREAPELVEAWRQIFVAQDVASMLTMLRSVLDREDLSTRLAEIAVPTLVIVGDEDVDPGVLASARIAARVPDARFEVLPTAGHLSAIEQPKAFGERLLRFLETRFPAPRRPRDQGDKPGTALP